IGFEPRGCGLESCGGGQYGELSGQARRHRLESGRSLRAWEAGSQLSAKHGGLTEQARRHRLEGDWYLRVCVSITQSSAIWSVNRASVPASVRSGMDPTGLGSMTLALRQTIIAG